MSAFQLKHRFSGAVLFECALPEDIAAKSTGRQLGYAVKEAIKECANLAGAYLTGANLARADLARAYLAGADLTGADLTGADLAGADLTRAYLTGAYLADANLALADLAGANLAGANLAGAYLAGANLAGANLAGAYLTGAYLAGANLAGANLAGANLAGANLAGAYLTGAYLADARNIPAGIEHVDPTEPYERKTTPERYRDRARAQRFRERNPDVPVIEDIDAKILGAIEAGGSLDMSQWHTCETTHCIAGWAITLAGEQGKALESAHGAEIAGRYLFLAATGRAPHFYATNERALEDLRARAQAAIDAAVQP